MLITVVAINYLAPVRSTPRISTVFIPHHDVVATQRKSYIASLVPDIKDRRILLLSPNHYNAGSGIFQTKSQAFSTQYGSIQIDRALLGTALHSGVIESDSTFDSEHGVKSLLPDIAELLPDQQILPIIINESATYAALDRLIGSLHKSCSDCIVLASIDFSHYQPYQLSEFHDDQTIRLLASADLQAAQKGTVEVGENKVMYAAMKWANLSNTRRFNLANRTNTTSHPSSHFLEGTTHLYGSYARGEPEPLPPSASFTLAGTITLNSNMISQSNPFQSLGERVLWGTDGVIAHSTTEVRGSLARAQEYLKISKLFTTPNQSTDAAYTINGNGASITVEYIAPETYSIALDDACYDPHCYRIAYIEWPTHYPLERKRQFSSTLIREGYDFIVGLSNDAPLIELQDGVPIIYSLGTIDVRGGRHTSLAIAGEISSQHLTLLPLTIDSNDGIPILNRSAENNSVLKQLFINLNDSLIDDRGGLRFTLNRY